MKAETLPRSFSGLCGVVADRPAQPFHIIVRQKPYTLTITRCGAISFGTHLYCARQRTDKMAESGVFLPTPKVDHAYIGKRKTRLHRKEDQIVFRKYILSNLLGHDCDKVRSNGQQGADDCRSKRFDGWDRWRLVRMRKIRSTAVRIGVGWRQESSCIH